MPPARLPPFVPPRKAEGNEFVADEFASRRFGRILLPTLYSVKGGSTRVLLATAEVLRPEFDVIVRGPISEADEQIPSSFPNRPLVGIARKLSAFLKLARLFVGEAFALRRLRPDAIHVHDEPSLYLYGLAARLVRPRPRIVWHVHIGAGSGRTARARTLLADIAVMISPHLDPVRRIPHVMIRNPLGAFRPNGVNAKTPADRLAAVGVVGSIYPLKGQDRAIEALAALKRIKGGEGARLTLVGPELDDDFARKLRERVAALGLDGSVDFAGPRAQEAAFDGIGLAVFPSHSENQPLALAEALAGGLPSVASDIPAHRTMLFEAGTSGAVLTNGEPEDFAAAILKAAQGAPLESVSRCVEELFSFERFRWAILDLHRRNPACRP